MGKLLAAVIIVLTGGFLFFVLGQALPRSMFRPAGWLYRSRRWERGGRIYERLYVRRWKDIVPDMSRIVPGVFRKKAGLARTPEMMYRLIQETCVAELIHWLLIIAVTPFVFRAISGIGGAAAALIYVAGNLVFVVIQRYNRPRLVALHKRMEKRREKCS